MTRLALSPLAMLLILLLGSASPLLAQSATAVTATTATTATAAQAPAVTIPEQGSLTALGLQDDPGVRMVAVEALVVEVDEERTRDLGLHYGIAPEGAAPDGGSVFDGGNVTLGRPLQPVRVPVLIKGLDGNTAIAWDNTRMPGLGVNLAGMNINGHVVSARLRALLDQGEAVIRTRPIAVALNGTWVNIQTVSNVPYLDRSMNDNLTVAEKEIGIQMTVCPKIIDLRTRLVELDLARLRVSSLSSFITTQNVDRPVINESEAHSRVTLREGETFVVGGLKTRRQMHYEERVPVLNRIPLVGMLFKSQEDLERNMDVLFFITPYILEPGQNFLLPFDFKNQRELGVDVRADLSER